MNKKQNSIINEIMELIDNYAKAKVVENSKNNLAAFFANPEKRREDVLDALIKMLK